VREPVFRLASNGDQAGIIAVVHGGLLEYGLVPDPEDTDADLYDVEGVYNNTGGRFWVLTELSGRIVGTCALEKVDEETVDLHKLYLQPEWRGKGWGKYMMEQAIHWAREQHFRAMRLETHTILGNAIGLYLHLGFIELPCAKPCSRCDRHFELVL